MHKVVQHFLFGFGCILDLFLSPNTPQLKQFKSSKDDLKNLSGDWVQVGHYIEIAMKE